MAAPFKLVSGCGMTGAQNPNRIRILSALPTVPASAPAKEKGHHAGKGNKNGILVALPWPCQPSYHPLPPLRRRCNPED